METNVKTSQRSQTRIFPARHFSRALAWLVLLLLAAAPLWQPRVQTAHGQASDSARFTGTLRFHEVAPGIEYGQTTSGHASKDVLTGPWYINVLRIDLSRANLKIVRALDEGVGMETVSSLAARHRAAAATNGGYFRTTGTYRGESIGLLLLDGKLISEPYNDRAELGLINRGNGTEVIFGHLKFSAAISAGSVKHDVQGLNRPLAANELVVFTPEFHRTTLTNPDGIEIVVRASRVSALRDFKGSTEIPPDGYVISGVGSAREWLRRNLRKGSKVAFSWSLNSMELGDHKDWRHASSLLGAGPQLIKARKIAITDKEEKMAPAFATDLHPRTAVAMLESGKLLLLTVDGRQPGVSAGMSLNMLAELLLELGAVEAINLDGGGSTTMVVRDKIVNRPSDQTGERPVSDAVLVFSKPE
jgi:exopolysaccharide biosynthesis protein